jgi:hypothetical protein
MALDCYHLTDIHHKYLLFQVEGYELDEIADELLVFKKRTGIYINLYDNTRLHQQFSELLMALITKNIDSVADKNRRHMRQVLLKKLSLSEEGLLMIGD